MHVVSHNAGGFVDPACGIIAFDGGKSDPDYVLSYPYYPLQGGALSKPGSHAAIVCRVW